MKKFSLKIIFLFLVLPSFAQEENFNFKRIYSESSESNKWIRCIFQDSQGYMWFGTADGLNRFDGYNIIIYRPTDSNNKALGSIHINDIIDKNENELWVATDIGLYIFNYQKDSLIPYPIIKPKPVLSIIKDNEGNIWLGSDFGVYKYNPADSTLAHYYSTPENKNSLSSNYVNAIFQDSKSNIWIATIDGLNLFQEDKNCFIQFLASDKPDMISGNDIISICEDKSNYLWIGTALGGLNIAIPGPNRTYRFEKVLDGHITHLLIDSDNYLWVGRSSNQGLIRIDLTNFLPGKPIQTRVFKNNPSDDLSISDNSVFCIYEDHAGDLWFGTFNNGVNFYSKRETKFFNVTANILRKDWIKNSRVNVIYEEDRYFWVGTEGGLDRYDKVTKTAKHFDADFNNPSSLGSNSIYAIYKDSRGNLWIGTWNGGLNLYNYKTELFRRYETSDKPGSISSNNVYSILEDRRGNLWIGTLGGGLNKFNYAENTFTHYLPKADTGQNLLTRSVNKIIETMSGDLLVSTYNSIDLYRPETDDFTHFIYSTSPGNKIVTIFEDSRNTLWIGTNNGISILDLKAGRFKPYDAAKELIDLTAQAIQEDKRGNLWISTNLGIYELISATKLPDALSIRHFTKADGLPENEFIKRSSYKNPNGILYFGSVGGYTFFNPDSISTNEVIPRVIITEFQLLISQKNKGTKYMPVKGNVNYFDKLSLPYKDRNFSLQFAALSYLHPEENQYQYILEGYDKDWIDIGNLRKATYTNIQPGKYTFMVRACNNDGVWCQQPKILSIVIYPPWWGSFWFRTLVFVIVIVSLISIYRLRFKYLESQKRLLQEKIKERTVELLNMNTLLEEKQEEITFQNSELEWHRDNLETVVKERTSELVKAKIEAEESNRLKSSFLANMSHEIRTPMNAIYGFSELLSDDSIDEADRARFISIINKNCDTLKVLIDDIIDISLIEANQLKIVKNTFDVDSVLLSIENYYKLHTNKKILCEFVNKDENNNLILNNDVIRFKQILTNLIENAFKYTETGTIKFGYESKGDFVRFFVADTGIGIVNSEIDKIFTTFYKVENNPNKLYRGTGIGLAICQNLVKSMGGKIWVESEVNIGSTFYFTLPIIKDMQPIKKESIVNLGTILPQLENVTVLVAEDEPSNFDLINALLKRYVFRIIWAKNGVDAIEFIKANPKIDKCIVLMDIKMPNINGYDAHKQIRKINPNIPVIAVTAYALTADKQKLMSEHFDAFILKPIKKEVLIETIVKVVSDNYP